MAQGSVHPDVMRAVHRAAEIEIGEDAHPIFAALDLSQRIPIAEALRVWNHLAECDKDGTLGARLGQHQLSHRGVLGALLVAAGTQATFATAMRVLSQYFSLVSSTAELNIEMRDGPEGREFVIRSVYGPGSRNLVVAQSTLFVLLAGIREITAPPIPLLRVTFAAPMSAQVCAGLRRYYGAPVVGGTGADCLVFKGSIATTPLPAELRAGKSTERVQAQAQLTIDHHAVIKDEVIKEIQMLLPGPTKIELVAARLALSPRVLQRRLNDEGLNYRDLAVQTRVDIALGYLKVGGTVAEVALLVGYADATAFTRMYKKATGRRPIDDRIPAAPARLK